LTHGYNFLRLVISSKEKRFEREIIIKCSSYNSIHFYRVASTVLIEEILIQIVVPLLFNFHKDLKRLHMMVLNNR